MHNNYAKEIKEEDSRDSFVDKYVDDEMEERNPLDVNTSQVSEFNPKKSVYF